jgi:hypothetical protein
MLTNLKSLNLRGTSFGHYLDDISTSLKYLTQLGTIFIIHLLHYRLDVLDSSVVEFNLTNLRDLTIHSFPEYSNPPEMFNLLSLTRFVS